MGNGRLNSDAPASAVRRGIAMTDKEFDVYFSRLEKVSDSTRSIIYVFIVVLPRIADVRAANIRLSSP